MFKSSQKELAGYYKRSYKRKLLLCDATMNSVKHFVDLGDDLETANDKVDQIADVILDNLPGAVIGYELGNTRQKQKLINGINNIDEVAFPFFNQAAKDSLISKL